MRKRNIFLLIIGLISIIALSTIASKKSDAQKILKASNKQFAELSEHLSEINISIGTIQPSTNKLVDDLGNGFEAYDITTATHESYILVLSSHDKSYVAVIDTSGNLVNGLIDNVVLPQLFK